MIRCHGARIDSCRLERERERYPWELIAYNGVFDIHSFTDTLLQSAEAGWEQLGKHTGGFGRGSQLGIPSAGYDLYNN